MTAKITLPQEIWRFHKFLGLEKLTSLSSSRITLNGLNSYSTTPIVTSTGNKTNTRIY